MSREAIVQFIAAAAVIGIVAAPHRQKIAEWASRANKGDIARWGAAAFIVTVVWGRQFLPAVSIPVPSVSWAMLAGLARLGVGLACIGLSGFLCWRRPLDDRRAATNLLLVATGLLLLGGAATLQVPSISWPSLPITVPTITTKPTAATYVYEKDDGPIPAGVASGIDRLNKEKKVLASLFEDDTVDGEGQTPDQYKPALAAAKAAGIPSLIVLAGTNVVATVKAPKTEDDLMKLFP